MRVVLGEWGGGSESLEGMGEIGRRGNAADQRERRNGQVTRGGNRFKRDVFVFVFKLGENICVS